MVERMKVEWRGEKEGGEKRRNKVEMKGGTRWSGQEEQGGVDRRNKVE